MVESPKTSVPHGFQDLSFVQLSDKVALADISLILLEKNDSINKSWKFPIGKMNAGDILKILKGYFPNHIVLNEDNAHIKLYILPSGIDGGSIHTDPADYWSRYLEKAHSDKVNSILSDKEINSFPQVKYLMELAEEQKGKKLIYDRILSGVLEKDYYRFEVDFFSDKEMFLPVRSSNDKKLGQMEGYAHFYGIYHFIQDRMANLEPSIFEDRLYLTVKGNLDTYISLELKDNTLYAVINNKMENTMDLTSLVSGAADEFIVYADISSSAGVGEVNIIDTVVAE